MKKTTVLIVGAGPTGLMMAAQLALFDIPFLIVDKESGPTKQSRAIGIQARSMEIFAQMGIVDTFLKHGEPAPGLDFIVNGRVVQHVPLEGLGKGFTEFPFLLIHEQSKTERALIQFIEKHSHTIEWNTEVLTFEQTKQHVIATIKKKDGTEEKIESDWITGADGAHSIVRHTLGIELAGKTYKQSLFVLDCKISSSLSHAYVSVALSDNGFAAFFPMTHDRWRIVGEIPEEVVNKNELTFEKVQQTFAEQMKIPLELSDPAWIAAYHSHHRCVARFRDDRAFLLGDAAHIHSPIGAQGMNTGLQDAYNLAWKLAFVEKGFAKESILNTYNEERLPFAKKLVETVDRLFNLVSSSNLFTVSVREHILPTVIKTLVTHTITGKFVFRTISQIGISYHSSALSHDASCGTFPKSAPKPGDRLPYILYQEHDSEKNIQDIITPTQLHLILFSGKNELDIQQIKDELKRYEHYMKITNIPLKNETKRVYQQLGIKNKGYYLIRPDSYVAFRSTSLNTTPLKQYLSRFFMIQASEH